MPLNSYSTNVIINADLYALLLLHPKDSQSNKILPMQCKGRISLEFRKPTHCVGRLLLHDFRNRLDGPTLLESEEKGHNVCWSSPLQIYICLCSTICVSSWTNRNYSNGRALALQLRRRSVA